MANAVLQKGYIRPDRRMGETAQLALLEGHCVDIYREPRPPAGHAMRERADAIAWMRSPEDMLLVSHLHRLGTGQRDLAEAMQQVVAKGGVVVEMSTGRRSAVPQDLVAMLADATVFYSKSLDPERAREIGKLGAAISSAARRRRDRMPIADGLAFVNDHKRFPNLVDALKAINEHKRYRRSWNIAYVYRLKRDGYAVKDRR